MKLSDVFPLRLDDTPWWAVFLLFGPSEGRASIGAQSFPLAGAYFPAWLICLFLGGVGAAVLRALCLMLGLEGMLRYHLVTYLSLGALVGLMAWLFLFGQ